MFVECQFFWGFMFLIKPRSLIILAKILIIIIKTTNLNVNQYLFLKESSQFSYFGNASIIYFMQHIDIYKTLSVHKITAICLSGIGYIIIRIDSSFRKIVLAGIWILCSSYHVFSFCKILALGYAYCQVFT
jgi:FtsH-binding integral membrane protein